MDGTEIRIARPDDLEEILDVCSVSLGWTNPEFDRALFTWKHETNPFGRSLIMVAESTNGLVAVRPFMRWRFRRGQATMTAARAVDTATHPAARGQGLFRTLTESGLELLRDEGVGIIFNTPNEKSRPGYLKMGWREAGKVPLGVVPAGLRSLYRLRGAQVAADKPSLPMTFGQSVEHGLNTATLDDRATSSHMWRSDHDLESLRWRYGGGPVDYRWIPGPNRSGLLGRARRRGTAVELLIAGTVGYASPAARKAAIKLAMKHAKADICIAPASFPGTIRVDRLGPTLTVRPVSAEPEPDGHSWQPGDIELF